MNQLNVSLWGDESFTAVAVQNSLPRMLEIVAKDTAPPLYYLFLFFWTRLFGNSEIAIRSLSVLLYLGTVLLVFLIAKKLWSKKAGWLAGLLALANPFLFPFAFEGRMYAILVFFVTLSFYFFLTNNRLGYILASAAGLYSHHYAALALAFQFLAHLGLNYRRLKKTQNFLKTSLSLLRPYLFIGLLYLPWVYPLYKQLTMVAGGFWLGRPKLKDLPLLYAKYLIGGQLLFPQQKYLLVLPVLILMLKKWRKNLKTNLILLGWAIVPVLIAFLISQGKTSLFYDRYLIFIIPALILLLATSLRKASLPLIIIFCLPLLYVNWHYFTHPTKRPFKQLAQYVKEQQQPSDFLINYNGSAHHLWETKFYGLKAPLYVPGGQLPYYVGTAQMTEKDILRQLPNQDRLGVIASEEPKDIQLPGYQLYSYEQFGELSFSWFTNEE